MKYEYLTNVPLEQAKSDYLTFLRVAGMRGREETIRVTEALGRISAHAVYTVICILIITPPRWTALRWLPP